MEEKREYNSLSIEEKFKILTLKTIEGKKIKEISQSDMNKIDMSKIPCSEIKFTYKIDIDFKVLYELGWFELDIIDLALFQIIARLLHYTLQKPKTLEGVSGEWYVLTEERIMLECPFIPLSSDVAIRKRMKKLEIRNLLEACPKNSIHRLKYFRLGSNAELLSGTTKKGD